MVGVETRKTLRRAKLGPLVRFYRPQLLAYALAASRATGCVVREAVLYFLTPDRLRSIPIDEAALREIQARVLETAS